MDEDGEGRHFDAGRVAVLAGTVEFDGVVIIMSLRDGFPSKQSPHSQGDCFAIARNDMLTVWLRALLPIPDKTFDGSIKT